MTRATVASIALTALLPAASAVAQPTISGVERRITTNLADQFDPAISGNVVVYTDMRGADADVWYYDLATGTEHSATTAPGDQQLADVSGPLQALRPRLGCPARPTSRPDRRRPSW